MLARLALTALAAAAVTTAQSVQVTIEASHGGAGSDLTNTTIEVPLNTRYTNSALDVVSALFLTGATGTALASVTCTPYRYDNLTGTAGLPFTSTSPSFLSTNTVQVGSLFCNSSGSTATTSTTTSSSSSSSSASSSSSSSSPSSSSYSPPSSTSTHATPTSTYSSATPTSTLHDTTSTGIETTTGKLTSVATSNPGETPTVVIVTTVPDNSHSVKPTTITSVEVITGGNGPVSSTVLVESTSTSAPPTLNSNSAAAGGYSVGWMRGVAMAGLGLMAFL